MFEICHTAILSFPKINIDCDCWKFTTIHMWGPQVLQCVECATNYDITHPGNLELAQALREKHLTVVHGKFSKMLVERDKLFEFAKAVSEQECNDTDDKYCLPCLAQQVLEGIKNAR